MSVIFEDATILAQSSQQAAVKGHVSVHVKTVEPSEDDWAEVMSAASYCSMALFESLQPQGTNIIISEHLTWCDVLARTETDTLSFQWQALQLSKDEMSSIAARIRSACDQLGSQELPAPQRPQVLGEEQKVGGLPSKKNYLLKQLRRVP